MKNDYEDEVPKRSKKSKEKEELREEFEELLERAKETYTDALEVWKDIHDKAKEDTKFYLGDQWDASADQAGIPKIDGNRLPTMGQQIENELRQQEIGINAAATDEEGSEETANIITSMIRAIEGRSNAKQAYIHAGGLNGALVPGFGYLRLDLEYEKPDSFDQDIWIRAVRDPFSVIPDPHAQQPDFSDGDFWFTFQDYPERTFKKLFPEADCVGTDFFKGEDLTIWRPEELYRVIRYWYKKEVSEYTFLLEDGTIITEEEVDDWDYEDENGEDKRFAIFNDEDGKMKDKKAILRNRRVTRSSIHWCDFTGAEILNEGTWSGRYFPLFGITGSTAYMDGKLMIRGMIRHAKDQQKLINFTESQMVQRMSQSTKSPYILASQQIAGYEKMWQTASKVNRPYLLYNAVDPNNSGSPLPPPQRADQTANVTDLIQALGIFENGLKAGLGIYDAGLGATPNEQSGVAIKTLAQQGKNANFHFSDNLVSAMKSLGVALIDLIPKVYDTERIVKTVSAEGDERLIKINALTEHKGEQTTFDIAGAAGHYGVDVNVGPAYATQKQAAIEQMTELARVNPQMMPYIQDELVRNMDFEGKDRVADRLLAVLQATAPGVVPDDDQPDVPPQVRAQMQQAQMQMQQLQQQNQVLGQELQKAQTALANKSTEIQGEMEKSKLQAQLDMQLQQGKTQGELMLQEARNKSNEMIQGAQMEIAMLKQQMQANTDGMRVMMDLIKTFGPAAGQAAASIVPQIDAQTDAAIANNMAPNT